LTAHGQYRSPEENRDEYLDEKIDIYSFGNNIYGLLTGLWVFYDTDDDTMVQVRDLCVGTMLFVDLESH
jgi:serine/threonine protein kinase